MAYLEFAAARPTGNILRERNLMDGIGFDRNFSFIWRCEDGMQAERYMRPKMP